LASALLFGVFAVLLIIGVPVAFALAAASLATVLYLGLPSIVVVQQLAAGASLTTLIAIPLFIFAGEMMMRGGISDRLIALASSLVGHLRGGLAQINVLCSLFFGGVSGSAVLRRLVAALPGLLLIGVIFGGIRAGVFTAIESASIAVVYASAVTAVIYRKLSWQNFVDACTGAVRTTGLIVFVIGAAARSVGCSPTCRSPRPRYRS
jgi:TRAP-type C4-dicarboxylate transport system permease large subunit